jgi:hypothetical protein
MIDSPSGRVPKKAPDGITEEHKLAVEEKLFEVTLCWFPNI